MHGHTVFRKHVCGCHGHCLWPSWFVAVINCRTPMHALLWVISVHCIFDRFFAIASSTAFSCISSSSRRDDVLFRFETPAAASDGCIRAGLDSGWSGRARDALTGERTAAAAIIAACGWLSRPPPRDGEVAVADFCVLSNFGIGIFTGSFNSVQYQSTQHDTL